MHISTTVVINAAGIGSRLGLGIPKSLLKIGNKTLIEYQLSTLTEIDDVRVVVGFNANEVIQVVSRFRPDAIIVFNHDYVKTNTLSSLMLGSRYTSNDILSLDGDLIVDPADMKNLLLYEYEFVGYTEVVSKEPVYINIKQQGKYKNAVEFSRKTKTPYEWTGLVKISPKKLSQEHGRQHVYHAIKKYLPMHAVKVSCTEIDTPADYDSAVEWIKEKRLFE